MLIIIFFLLDPMAVFLITMVQCSSHNKIIVPSIIIQMCCNNSKKFHEIRQKYKYQRAALIKLGKKVKTAKLKKFVL